MKCSIEICQKESHSRGLCINHYQQLRKRGLPPREPAVTNHPFYIMWWQRKRDKVLCDAWLDFKTFVSDIGERVSKDHYLVRLRDEPFGPDNFKWVEHLRKRDDESFSQWYARKRANRIAANPSMESDRNRKRSFGLTRLQYDAMLKAQNFVCAICKEPEKSIDGRTGSLKALAVDHCHDTGKIRELLCWKCNVVLGKLNDDLDFLDKLREYLVRHL